MGGREQMPFAVDLLQPPQQNAPQALAFFDLPIHRFHKKAPGATGQKLRKAGLSELRTSEIDLFLLCKQDRRNSGQPCQKLASEILAGGRGNSTSFTVELHVRSTMERRLN